jgi:uncharacterized protein YndB with AHSA1/START domain
MKTNLLFEFSVDKENKTVTVNREFNAPIQKIWAAWTQADLLDQWWAPKPYKAVTTSMDLREGGTWQYYMLGPEGQKHHCRADYQEINKPVTLSWLDAFTDSKGNIDESFPRSSWENTFRQENGSTVVSIVITHKTVAELEKILEMGFKEGFTMGLENLDELLEKNQ